MFSLPIRFSTGTFTLGHVGPEAAVGGPIALIEDGDEIIVDLNTSEINCPALDDAETKAARQAAARVGSVGRRSD